MARSEDYLVTDLRALVTVRESREWQGKAKYGKVRQHRNTVGTELQTVLSERDMG